MYIMNEQEFTAKNLFEKESLEKRFVNGVPSIEEINKAIDTLSIAKVLNNQLEIKERECVEYQKQLCEMNLEPQKKEKKNFSFLVGLLFYFFAIIAGMAALAFIFGMKFLELLKITGLLFLGLTLGTAIWATVVKMKEKKTKKVKKTTRNHRFDDIKEKLDATKAESIKMRENIQNAEQIAGDLLKKYGQNVEREAYMQTLLQLKKDVDAYTSITCLN